MTTIRAMLEFLHGIHEFANLAIFAGYMLAAYSFMWRLKAPQLVQYAGAAFFVGCAGTHLFMAWAAHELLSYTNSLALVMTGWHALEAISIWVFLTALNRFGGEQGLT